MKFLKNKLIICSLVSMLLISVIQFNVFATEADEESSEYYLTFTQQENGSFSFIDNQDTSDKDESIIYVDDTIVDPYFSHYYTKYNAGEWVEIVLLPFDGFEFNHVEFIDDNEEIIELPYEVSWDNSEIYFQMPDKSISIKLYFSEVYKVEVDDVYNVESISDYDIVNEENSDTEVIENTVELKDAVDNEEESIVETEVSEEVVAEEASEDIIEVPESTEEEEPIVTSESIEAENITSLEDAIVIVNNISEEIDSTEEILEVNSDVSEDNIVEEDAEDEVIEEDKLEGFVSSIENRLKKYQSNNVSTIDLGELRFIIETSDSSVFVETEPIIAEYDNIYILQFDNEEIARAAYNYYLDKVDSIIIDGKSFSID